jgi:hypothetical protein
MPYILKFTDAVRARLADDLDFWSSASCRTAAARIAEIVGNTIPYDAWLNGFARGMREDSPDVSLAMFDVATLHLALLASLHRESRNIMGF